MVRGWRSRAVAVAAVLGVVAGACSSSSADEPTGPVASIGGASESAEPSPSPTPDAGPRTEAVAQDWTVPDPITEEYVEQVLIELERLLANFDRWLIDSEPYEQIPEDVEADFLSVYHHLTASDLILDVWRDHGDRADGRPLARRPFGQDYPTDVEMLRATPTCLVLRVDWDTSETVVEGATGRGREIIVLVPTPPAQIHVNPTGWVTAFKRLEERVDPDDLAGTVAGGPPCDG